MIKKWDNHFPGGKCHLKAEQTSPQFFEQENFDDATRISFKASRGWVEKFLIRHNLTNRKRTTVSQKTPAQLIPKLVDFVIKIRTLRLKFNYPVASIGAMDETAVWVDMLAETTVENMGAKTVAIKATGNKTRPTGLMLTCYTL